jgi:hypothetical protein
VKAKWTRVAALVAAACFAVAAVSCPEPEEDAGRIEEARRKGAARRRRRGVLIAVVAVVAFLIVATVSMREAKNIPKRYYADYAATVMADTSASKVKIYFSRPSLKIKVYVPASTTEEEMEEILELTKPFVTADRMSEIGEYVKWGEAIRDVYLVIMNEETRESLIAYEADRSPENINGYETWRDSGLVWKE